MIICDLFRFKKEKNKQTKKKTSKPKCENKTEYQGMSTSEASYLSCIKVFTPV